jgi:hypothetical protein
MQYIITIVYYDRDAEMRPLFNKKHSKTIEAETLKECMSKFRQYKYFKHDLSRYTRAEIEDVINRKEL